MIGIDIIKTQRMQELIKKYDKKILQRFLVDEEIALVKNYKTAAGFWAVKEAFSKALGVGIGRECSFYDIIIFKDAKGAPKIQVTQKLKENFNIIETSISITHDGEYAIAVATITCASS